MDIWFHCCNQIHSSFVFVLKENMAREKLSDEERRRRNREYQRKRREKLNGDPEKKYVMQEAERQRWKRRVQDKKVTQIDMMSDRAQRQRRKYWREAKTRSRQKRSSEVAVQDADR